MAVRTITIDGTVVSEIELRERLAGLIAEKEKEGPVNPSDVADFIFRAWSNEG